MKSTCIQHPPSEPLIIIRHWQVEATKDHCAAALLSYLEYWHNIRLDMRGKAETANRVAEGHGDIGTQDTSLYQFHTSDEIERGMLGLYGKVKIAAAIEKLVELGFVTVHRNPNPRYHFDATKHFLFQPDTVNAWLANRKQNSDLPKRENAVARNERRSATNGRAIPEITPESSVIGTVKSVPEVEGLSKVSNEAEDGFVVQPDQDSLPAANESRTTAGKNGNPKKDEVLRDEHGEPLVEKTERLWKEAFSARFGAAWVPMNYGANRAAIKRVIRAGWTPEGIVNVAKEAWKQKDEKQMWRCLKRSRNLVTFCTDINDIQVELNEQRQRLEYSAI